MSVERTSTDVQCPQGYCRDSPLSMQGDAVHLDAQATHREGQPETEEVMILTQHATIPCGPDDSPRQYLISLFLRYYAFTEYI